MKKYTARNILLGISDVLSITAFVLYIIAFLKSQMIKNQAALDVLDPAPLVRCSSHKICDDSQPVDRERKDVRDD